MVRTEVAILKREIDERLEETRSENISMLIFLTREELIRLSEWFNIRKTLWGLTNFERRRDYGD